MFFEELGKVIGVTDAAVLGNGLYLKLGGAKKLSCRIHASGGYVIGNGFAGFFMKERAEITGVKVV